MNDENLTTSKYKIRDGTFFKPNEMPPVHDRPQIGVIGTNGVLIPDMKFYFATMNRIMFRETHHPVIHFPGVYMNQLDQFVYYWASRNWYTMVRHYDNKYLTRIKMVAECVEHLIVWYGIPERDMNEVISFAEGWGTKVSVIYF